jgi:hypothetical protein
VAAEAMGAVNVSIARLVVALRHLLATDGWAGHGISSPEHWLTWKAGLAHNRAAGLVCVARRADELPACFAALAAGRLGEDAMVRIARRVPASRDAEMAALAPTLLISQLDRVLRALPERSAGADERPEPERMLRLRDGRDGWLRGEFCLPADEGALVRQTLVAAREAEFRDRSGPASDASGDTRGVAGSSSPDGPMAVASPAPVGATGVAAVTWVDGLVRAASEAADALDPTLARIGHRGERNLVVLHHDVGTDGTTGPGQIELGPVVPDTVARFMACDARVQVMTHRAGSLVGINPADRTVSRATRRYLARRDQGCTHPLCAQSVALHAHHIRHWADGGLSTPANLTLLCPTHHRALHHGEFSVDGDPEAGRLLFRNRWGEVIAPPEPPLDGGTPGGGPSGTGPPPPTYTPPLAERLRSDSFVWN